jgi:predicted transcriptional regulator
MVEHVFRLDNVFQALSNEHRRDILRRFASTKQTAGRLEQAYCLTLVAVAKHFAVLERAGLLLTEKRGGLRPKIETHIDIRKI